LNISDLDGGEGRDLTRLFADCLVVLIYFSDIARVITLIRIGVRNGYSRRDDNSPFDVVRAAWSPQRHQFLMQGYGLLAVSAVQEGPLL